MIQDEDAVAVRCQDKSVYVADLLVGADGAYSGVRQSLYTRLEKEKLLPECDKRSLNKGYFCLVGTTDRLDPSRFPQLRELYSDASMMISDNSPHSVRNDALDCWLYFVAAWLPPLIAVVAEFYCSVHKRSKHKRSKHKEGKNVPLIKYTPPKANLGSTFLQSSAHAYHICHSSGVHSRCREIECAGI